MPEPPYPWLADATENDAVIVTANRRLARDLRQVHTRLQLDAGLKTWRTPEIHFWGDWLNRLVDTADLSGSWPTRIDQNSATIVWERCLAEHTPDLLLSFPSAVRLARQTWQRLQDYRVSLEELLHSSGNIDQQQFARAARAYQETLRRNHWIDAAMLPATITDALESRLLRVPERVTFTAFDRNTPAVERIVRQLRQQNCGVEYAPGASRNEELLLRTFHDRQEELRAAGLWARQFLSSFPDGRVAIICPDLEADAPAAARLVREGFVPGWQYAGDAGRNAVNVSYGGRLSEYPAVTVALSLLHWIHHGLPSRELGILLRSPFIVGDDTSGRSRYDLELRRWPDRLWTPASLAALLRGRDTSADALRWMETIDRIIALREEHRSPAGPSRWAELVDRFLTESGWPGESAPDSAGFQLLNRWRALLAEFAATGLVTPNISLSAAIERIRIMASEVIFQPEGDAGILQLLGVLEATGMSLDAAWVCGLDSTRWPPAPNPLVLVSRALQERHAMPHATPRDSIEFAELVLRRIADSASRVVLSRASSDGEAELSPSPMLATLPVVATESFPDPGWHARHLQDPAALVLLDNDPAPAVQLREKITGGAYTVQLQATEPFTAFAHGRLHITEIQRIESGLAAAFKGSLAHQALYALLAGTPDSNTIAAWTDAEVMERIDNALSAVLLPAQRHLNDMHRRLLEIEQRRLRTILRKFVDAERSRPPFAVEFVEHRIDFERFGVCLGLRVDRIDRLADNTRLIIDYKTGMPKSLLDRNGDLADLQLVVYAIAVGGSIGGLVLINVDSSGISYKGTGGSVEWDAKRRADWAERLAAWSGSVEQALKQIAQGDVRLDTGLPDEKSQALAVLSRVEELRRDG